MSVALPVRVFDLWAHEQDIRRALGLPIRTECVAAEVALERSLLGWSMALPKRLEVDAELVVDVTGPRPFEQRISLGGGDRRSFSPEMPARSRAGSVAAQLRCETNWSAIRRSSMP